MGKLGNRKSTRYMKDFLKSHLLNQPKLAQNIDLKGKIIRKLTEIHNDIQKSGVTTSAICHLINTKEPN